MQQLLALAEEQLSRRCKKQHTMMDWFIEEGGGGGEIKWSGKRLEFSRVYVNRHILSKIMSCFKHL